MASNTLNRIVLSANGISAEQRYQMGELTELHLIF